MRGKTLENVMQLSKMMLSQVVKEGFKCIDATTGNGNDTLYLSELVGENGFVYGFDVQAVAVENTMTLLKEHGHSHYKIIHDGHEKILNYIDEKIDFIIFNLGYLPKADKSIKTKDDTTLQAIQASMKILKPFGILWIVVYPGHEEGKVESEVLESYFKTLNQKEFNVMKLEFINQVNNPPYILALEKKVE